jgi:hypothetical protein
MANQRSTQVDADATQQVDSVDISNEKKRVVAGEGNLWCLEIVRGAMAGEKVALKEGTQSFGRAAECDVFLDDITVSRHHCDIIVADDGVTVKDCGSTNGTLVDSQAVESKKLEAGDVIQIGRFVFLLTRRSA